IVPNTSAAISSGTTAKLVLSSASNGLLGLALTSNSRSASLASARNFDSSSASESTSLVIPISTPPFSVTAGANLEMAMTAVPALSVVQGTDITYTLTSTNRGPDSAFNVIVRDTLPVNTTFVSAAPSAGGTCTQPPEGSPGTVVCTFSGTT